MTEEETLPEAEEAEEAHQTKEGHQGEEAHRVGEDRSPPDPIYPLTSDLSPALKMRDQWETSLTSSTGTELKQRRSSTN